jgi:hypothetical protein
MWWVFWPLCYISMYQETDFKEKRIYTSRSSSFTFFSFLVTLETQGINITQHVRRKSLPGLWKHFIKMKWNFSYPVMHFFSSLASVLFLYVLTSACFFQTTQNISRRLHDIYSLKMQVAHFPQSTSVDFF